MPIVTPVHAISRGGSTSCSVDRNVVVDFQTKVVPGSSGPCRSTLLIAWFHEGQFGRSEITLQTTSGDASIRSSPSAVAGAVPSMSMMSPYSM